MDPYLERRWSDVHVRLIGLISEALQPLLPRDLRARAEERVLLEDAAGDARSYRSDVAVVTLPRDSHRGVTPNGGSAGTAVLEPVVVELREQPLFDRFVQIIDRSSGGRVVTAIEVLSPGNKKSGRLHDDYRGKLADYAAGNVNVVEIDLLRGTRAGWRCSTRMCGRTATPYLACVRRGRATQSLARLSDAAAPTPSRRAHPAA
jgi:hypothetical protein